MEWAGLPLIDLGFGPGCCDSASSHILIEYSILIRSTKMIAQQSLAQGYLAICHEHIFQKPIENNKTLPKYIHILKKNKK
jgi:hypothetical protein